LILLLASAAIPSRGFAEAPPVIWMAPNGTRFVYLNGAEPPDSQLDLTMCESQISRYGDGKGPTSIHSNCLIHAARKAAFAAIGRSEDGKIVASGYQKMLVIKTSGTNAVFAGSATNLNDVRALSLDLVNHETAVLDGPSVLFFFNDLPGNVLPRRTLRTPELKEAVAVAVDSSRDELLAVNGTTATIDFYSRLGDIYGRRSERRLDSLRKLGGPATNMISPSAVAVDTAHGEIFVADRGANQILVFDWRARDNAAPRRVLSGGSTSIFEPAAISYLPSSDQIEVVNGDGDVLRFPRTASGDVSPQE
jgi:hypothetical protein